MASPFRRGYCSKYVCSANVRAIVTSISHNGQFPVCGYASDDDEEEDALVEAQPRDKLVVSARPCCADASFTNKRAHPSTGTSSISFTIFGGGCGPARVPICLPWSCAVGHFPRRCLTVTTTSPHLLWHRSSALERSVNGIPPSSTALMTRTLRTGSPPLNV